MADILVIKYSNNYLNFTIFNNLLCATVLIRMKIWGFFKIGYWLKGTCCTYKLCSALKIYKIHERGANIINSSIGKWG